VAQVAHPADASVVSMAKASIKRLMGARKGRARGRPILAERQHTGSEAEADRTTGILARMSYQCPV
jgi:hypothetical protein